MKTLTDKENGRRSGHGTLAGAAGRDCQRCYPEQRSNRNRRKSSEISYLRISTRNSLRHSESLSLTFLTVSVRERISRYTCRDIFRVTLVPSTKLPKFPGTLCNGLAHGGPID